MKKMHIGLSLEKSLTKLFTLKGIVLLLMCFMVIFIPVNTSAQQPSKTVAGTVLDNSGAPLLGVTVLVKGTTIGTITDINGNFSLSVPGDARTLVFSFVGMTTQEVAIGNQTRFNVTLAESEIGLAEVIVVGYGSQKKESVVGAIVQTTSEELARTGGVANLAQALTGNLAGVTTIQGSGLPGGDDPRIIIRAQGTWNNSNPLILVDGIERRMNDLDISEVESVSVLKDASATAVFGVKGSEGVILITTKRGKIGKPKITVDANSTGKMLSRTPDKLESYDMFMYRNSIIERELPISEASWSYIKPKEVAEYYRNPNGTFEGIPNYLIFPNVDWPKEMVKPVSWAHRVNWNISGGTEFAKYFGSVAYNYDSDLLISGQENMRPYSSDLSYDRFNYRTNVDFNLTKTTLFSVNIAGWIGTTRDIYATTRGHLYKAFYELPPDVFPVRWPTGEWGYYLGGTISNPVAMVNNYGVEKTTKNNITTDFILRQKLDFITEGLSVGGSLSYDSQFTYAGGIFEQGVGPTKYISPDIVYKTPTQTAWDYTYGSVKPTGMYQYYMAPPDYRTESIAAWGGGNDYWGIPYGAPYRRLFYQFKADYARVFGKHDVGVTALMNREEYATGSMFPRYREDWVGRLTYSYDQRYLFETNAAYNGSEKFGQENRFGFFPSAAFGWVISNEEFLKRDWLDKLKIRYSIGKVGNDNFDAPRWSYQTTWAIGDRVTQGTYQSGNATAYSPYYQYIQASIGNPALRWEASLKQNLGIEVAVLKNRLSANIDIFRDHRTDIFMSASQRKISAVWGANAVADNLGETKTRGYEVEFKFQNTSSNNLYYWLSSNFTRAVDEIIFMEDPELLPDYQKAKGFQISQTKGQTTNGYLNTWDELYGSTKLNSGDAQRLPGDLFIVDYNADGFIDSYDSAPRDYPTRPMNTWSTSLGFEYKGFSAMVQFYGVFNVSRHYTWTMEPFRDNSKAVCLEFVSDSWTPDNLDADFKASRLLSTSGSFSGYASQFLIDASYTRLKTAEIAYTFGKLPLKKLGVNAVRLYVNGNNLIFWSDMVDDREAELGEAYPMYKRINLGINIVF